MKIDPKLIYKFEYPNPDALDLYKMQKVKVSDLISMLEAYNGILKDEILFSHYYVNCTMRKLKLFPNKSAWISYRISDGFNVALIKLTMSDARELNGTISEG